MVGSFWLAAAVSWFTVTAGAWTVFPSRELERTGAGLIAVLGVGFAARSAMSAFSCRELGGGRRGPVVAPIEASLAARVLMLGPRGATLIGTEVGGNSTP